jgi:hypothetical protein
MRVNSVQTDDIVTPPGPEEPEGQPARGAAAQGPPGCPVGDELRAARQPEQAPVAVHGRV